MAAELERGGKWRRRGGGKAKGVSSGEIEANAVKGGEVREGEGGRRMKLKEREGREMKANGEVKR